MKLEADEALWFVFEGYKPKDAKRRRWPVVLVHHDHERMNEIADGPLCGATDYERRCIWIDASRTDRSMLDTLVHEAAHCVLIDSLPSGVLRLRCADDLEEALIRDVSPALLRNLRIVPPPFPPDAVALIRAARRHRRRAA